jgi:hypothetical protein
MSVAGRIGVVSGSGGECTLVSDAAANVGLEVPELTEATKSQLQQAVADFGNMNNPLDGTGAMYDDPSIFPRLLQGLIDDANIDVVTVNLEANDPRPKELKVVTALPQLSKKPPARAQADHLFQLRRRWAGGSRNSFAVASSRRTAHGGRRVRHIDNSKTRRILRVPKK